MKWKGRKRIRYKTKEKRLLEVLSTRVFQNPEDYLNLIPEGLTTAFTARELSKRLNLRINLARRMVYTFSKMDLLQEVGLIARAKLYKVLIND